MLTMPERKSSSFVLTSENTELVHNEPLAICFEDIYCVFYLLTARYHYHGFRPSCSTSALVTAAQCS